MPIVLSSPPNKSAYTTESIILYRSTPIITHVIHILMAPERRSNKIIHVNYPQTHVYGYPHVKSTQAARLELNITIQVLSLYFQGPR